MVGFFTGSQIHAGSVFAIGSLSPLSTFSYSPFGAQAKKDGIVLACDEAEQEEVLVARPAGGCALRGRPSLRHDTPSLPLASLASLALLSIPVRLLHGSASQPVDGDRTEGRERAPRKRAATRTER